MNLFDLFYKNVEKQPEHPLIFGPEDGKVYSYRDFYHLIVSLTDQLKASGLNRGQCVGLHYPSGRQYIALTYAIWACGGCVVPIPVELTSEEKQQIFHNICIDAVISKADLASSLQFLEFLNNYSVSEDAVFNSVKRLREPPPGFEQINAAFIRFSSGTTAMAKGIVLSHETIEERIQGANQGLQIGPNDRILWLLSMAHHFAVSIVAYLSFGASIILCPNHFGSTILRTASKHQATLIYGAPTHYELMTHDRTLELPSSLRLAIATTTTLRKKIATAFHHRFHRALNETYGIIEIGLPCVNLEKPWEKSGSVGRPLPAYEISLKEGEDTQGLGAIHVRGVGILDAYYEPWQTRAEILQNNQGWFFTGDLGYLDEEGYLYICGRSKEVISVGGMKFFPQEVEAVLESHPAVREACVFRYQDERFGEVPYAHLVLKPGLTVVPSEADWKDFCISYLATYKIPEKFIVVDKLVKTASGKIIHDASKLQAGSAKGEKS